MDSGKISPGRVYLVWRSRKLVPVYIDRRNVHGGYDGHLWPSGRTVRVKDANKISGEYKTQPQAAPFVDYKSRAAGERED